MRLKGFLGRRRLVGLLAAVAMVAGMAPVAAASATDGNVAIALVPTPTPGFPSTAGTVVLAPGSQVTLDVQATVSNSTYGLGSWTVNVGYNSGVAVVTETACTGGCNVVPSNPVTLAGASASGLGNSATPYTLGSITFQGANPGSTTLAVSAAVYDAQGNDMTSTTQTVTIVVPNPPAITGVSPPAGPVGGGFQVTVSGNYIQNGAQVSFGGTPGFAGTYIYNSCNAATPSICSSLTVEAPPNGSVTFGDVNGDSQVTAVDALCLLRDIAGLGYTANCPQAAQTSNVTLQLTNPDGQSTTAPFTYWNFDVSGSDGGTPSAVDALCVLRQVLDLPATTGCPGPALP